MLTACWCWPTHRQADDITQVLFLPTSL